MNGKNGENRTRVAILGASGYTGADLVRLLVRHPMVDIQVLTAERRAGQAAEAILPHLGGLGLPDMLAIDQVEWAGIDVDVVFCALPHGTSQEIVAGLMHATGHGLVDEIIVESREDLISGLKKAVKVIDLSADFRFEDPEVYAEWYGHAHRATGLQAQAVYGLSELAREDIKEARLVACPGCYPTAVELALAPLLEAGLIESSDIIIDAKSGVSGAGRGLNEETIFAEVAESVAAYSVARHRHAPEIEQQLTKAAGTTVTVSFTPHLIPMNRGELCTMYVRTTGGSGGGGGAAALRQALEARFNREPFVRVLAEGQSPATRQVRGSNMCLIGVFDDRPAGRAIVLSALDNLVKGSSGQAIQNMNLMQGYPETLGLEQAPLFP